MSVSMLRLYVQREKIEEKKMKIALYKSQRENHAVATREALGDLGLKSQPKRCYNSCLTSILRWF